MSLIHGDIAVEHKDDAKLAIARIVYTHYQKKDEYDSDSEFIADLSEKIVDRLFIEKVVVVLLTIICFVASPFFWHSRTSCLGFIYYL
ncbi:MAG TPA: hypothetical protein VLA13_10480, partial [Massilibacterium sp.]|nr:hypothetical protein [Massilibacterium sp.]